MSQFWLPGAVTGQLAYIHYPGGGEMGGQNKYPDKERYSGRGSGVGLKDGGKGEDKGVSSWFLDLPQEMYFSSDRQRFESVRARESGHGAIEVANPWIFRQREWAPPQGPTLPGRMERL